MAIVYIYYWQAVESVRVAVIKEQILGSLNDSSKLHNQTEKKILKVDLLLTKHWTKVTRESVTIE